MAVMAAFAAVRPLPTVKLVAMTAAVVEASFVGSLRASRRDRPPRGWVFVRRMDVHLVTSVDGDERIGLLRPERGIRLMVVLTCRPLISNLERISSVPPGGMSSHAIPLLAGFQPRDSAGCSGSAVAPAAAATNGAATLSSMATPVRRVLTAAAAVAVAVLVLFCTALVRHDAVRTAAGHAEQVPTLALSMAGDSTTLDAMTAVSHGHVPARHDAPASHCSMTDLVACVRNAGDSMASLLLVAAGVVALAVVGANAARRPSTGLAWLLFGGFAPPPLAPPSLTTLCISRT